MTVQYSKYDSAYQKYNWTCVREQVGSPLAAILFLIRLLKSFNLQEEFDLVHKNFK